VRWYKRSWAAVTLLIVFFPVGLFLMWRYQTWDKLGKTCVTALTVVLVLCGAVLHYTGNATPITVVNVPKNTRAPAITPAPSEQPAPTFTVNPTATIEPAATIEPTATAEPTTAIEPTSTTKAPPASKAPPTQVPTAKPTIEPTVAPEPVAVSEPITLVAITSPVSHGEKATVMVRAAPDTQYEIAVYYKSKSGAAGLDPAVSDADGYVSWTWRVGGGTKAGDYYLEIAGGGDKLRVNFTVE
jgi:hypothetical protein